LSRRIRAWLEKNLISRERLRGERIHKIFGDRLFTSEIWHIDRFSISGGLALGLFVAFTPTIPFQMTIAALCSIWLRVNLPIALAACWITNPLTLIPFYRLTYNLGYWSLGSMPGIFSCIAPPGRSGIMDIFTKAAYLWSGGVLVGSAAAFAGYGFVRILWHLGSSQEKHGLK
jgi:hypothetical protein